MARNGSGVYLRIHNWVVDKSNTIAVTASRMDAEDDSIATALTGSIAADGQTTITANLKMSGKKHTGVADGTAADDYLNVKQFQNQDGTHFTSTGSANAYVLTPAPASAAYVAGQTWNILSNFANTGSATLAVSGLAAKTIKTPDGNALIGTEIGSSQLFVVTYDGTDFILISVTSLAPLESFIVPVSDETSDLSTGTAKLTFRMPYAFTLLAGEAGIRANVNTAPTGSGITIDVNEAGSTILSTKITIAASAKTSVGGTPPVISDTALAADAEITIDIDVIGSTIAGTGAKVTFIGHRT